MDALERGTPVERIAREVRWRLNRERPAYRHQTRRHNPMIRFLDKCCFWWIEHRRRADRSAECVAELPKHNRAPLR
jgi:hypothetical protein